MPRLEQYPMITNVLSVSKLPFMLALKVRMKCIVIESVVIKFYQRWSFVLFCFSSSSF